MASTTESSLEKRLTEQQPFLPDNLYYALTITATEGGEVVWTTQTRWAGWVDDECRFEKRVARLVYGDRYAEFLKSLGEPVRVVNDASDLHLFLLIGGHALIAKSVAETHLPELLEPDDSARSGQLGFISLSSIPKSQLNHAPTPTQRMRILKRDEYRCRICGRRPADYVDVELHVHHIRPWASGGLTEDANLITLCHTCHKGLDPHEDHNLFNFIREASTGGSRRKGNTEFEASVTRYQAIMSGVMGSSETTPSNKKTTTRRTKRRT